MARWRVGDATSRRHRGGEAGRHPETLAVESACHDALYFPFWIIAPHNRRRHLARGRLRIVDKMLAAMRAPALNARAVSPRFVGAKPRAVKPPARGFTRPGDNRRRFAQIFAAAGEYSNEIPPAMQLVTVTEPETNRTLLCMLRRRFKLADGEERCLCLPLDHPIDVLRGEGLDETEDLSDIGDDELAAILPDMSMELAKKGMLLQRSAFCMTVRGAVRFNETDTLVMDTGMDEESEGVEVATFSSGGSKYLVYAPMNPVLLVTKEDPASGEHTVMFDEEMDDDVLEENMAAVEEELTDAESELFDDMAGLFDDEPEDGDGGSGDGRGGGRGGRGGGRGGRGKGGGRGGGRGRGGKK